MTREALESKPTYIGLPGYGGEGVCPDIEDKGALRHKELHQRVVTCRLEWQFSMVTS
jgi:hypothetical protein